VRLLYLGGMRSLEDILDSGPSPADPPEPAEDWRLFEELAAAAVALAERLRHEPGLSRTAGQLFVKTETKVSGIHFRSLIWPVARRLARLPVSAGKGGRPRKKSGAETGRPVS